MPPAKPSMMLFIFTLNLWRKKNTQALPIVVAAKTIDKEMIAECNKKPTFLRVGVFL